MCRTGFIASLLGLSLTVQLAAEPPRARVVVQQSKVNVKPKVTNKQEQNRQVVADKAKEAKRKLRVVRAQAAAALQARQSSRNPGVAKDVDRKDASKRGLVLTPAGPIVIEFRIMVDGKPYRELTESIVDEMMKDADTDKDGKATWKEAVANARFGFGRFGYLQNEAARSRMIMSLDLDRDGLVSRYESRAMIARYFGVRDAQIIYTAARATAVTARSVIDTNGDKVLSKEECLAATKNLKIRDADDNDVLVASEIGDAARANLYAQQRVSSNRSRVPVQGNRVYHLNTPKSQLVYVYRALEKQYGIHDADKIQGPIVKAFIAAMDANKNGDLDLDDMSQLAKLKPQLVVEMDMKRGDANSKVRVKRLADNLGSLDKAGKEAVRVLMLRFPTMKIAMVGNSGGNAYSNRYDNVAKSMITRFDTNKNAYLEKDELESSPQYARMFAQWDGDGDKKVYAKEIIESYERMQRPNQNRLMIRIVDEDNAVFTLLDANADGQLGLREIQNAPKLLKTLDKNGDGNISVAELPHTVRCTVSRGVSRQYYLASNGAVYNQRSSTARRTTGPAWFVRMDRNGDGDVSRREFPGDDGQFKKLDRNNDGFVETAEANAVEESEE